MRHVPGPPGPRAPRPAAARRAYVAVALLAAAAAGLATPAIAAVADDGLWYVAAASLDEAQAVTRGEGVVVAVLDGAINPDVPELAGVDLRTRPDALCAGADGAVLPAVTTAESAEHATRVTSLIAGTGAGAAGQPGVRGVAPGVTVLHYAVELPEGACDEGVAQAEAIDAAVAEGARIINISISGGFSEASEKAVLRAHQAGVIVVASSNNRGGGDLGWPAEANGVVSVESGDAQGQLNPEAAFSEQLAVVAPGEAVRALSWSGGAWDTYELVNGSSFAAAYTTGALALAWSAFPDATSNQVIQSLLRNVTGGDGELSRDDDLGYGLVSAINLVRTDPTSYPDENPQVLPGELYSPTAEEIAGAAATPEPEPSAEATETAAPEPGAAPEPESPAAGAGSPPVALVVGGVVLLVAVAVVVGVLARRRRPAPGATAAVLPPQSQGPPGPPGSPRPQGLGVGAAGVPRPPGPPGPPPPPPGR